MKQHILKLLSETMPSVNFNSDFLFNEMDSLGIVSIVTVLSEKYGINIEYFDVTPKNFKSITSITRLVEAKLKEKFKKNHLSLEESICKFASLTPDKTAAVCGDESITYSELWKKILERSAQLEKEGVTSRKAYVFRASQDIDFLVTYCAVHQLNAIATPLGHDETEENFEAVMKTVSECKFPDDIADALFTTGTTGKSKGVMLSQTALIACTDNFIHDLGFTSDLAFIVSGPLNHIATLSKINPTLTVGGTVCILDGLKDMNAFFSVFDLPFKKFATFLVPASIRMIMQFSFAKLQSLAGKIDFIETGAAPITQTDMRRLSEALPHSRLYNTYGGTEIGAVCTYNFNDGKYMEGCIGRPMKNSSVEVLPDGSMTVSGLTIMSGYIGDEDETAKVIVDGEIHGSDLGYVDEDGLIHLTGRKGDVINVGGYKVNPVEVENAAAGFPSLKDCICIAAENPIIGTILKLLVVLEDGVQPDWQALSQYLKTKLEPFKVPALYESVERIQRTYNGKLDRKFYKKTQSTQRNAPAGKSENN